jgi:hypothetical protein
MAVPGVTVGASAALLRVSEEHCTVVVADDCSVPELLALKLAVLAYCPQLEIEVLLVT